MARPVAVDLFAGGGGLTVGLKAAGFRVAAAVEIYGPAAATYAANHPEVELFREDIRAVPSSSFAEASPTGKVDLLAGCPPCQGFSSLTSKYSKRDNRNTLIREVGRLVRELKPKAVMIENVPGLAAKGRRYFSEFVTEIKALGYRVNHDVLQVADYGVPQSRRRLVVLAGLGFEIKLPDPTHSRDGGDGLKPWRTVRDILRGEGRPVTLTDSLKRGGPGKHNWHVVRTLSEENRARLRAARIGRHWASIPASLRPACHQDANVGFSNAYGRMRWDLPSPTITGGCTSISKGRFGHPTQLRTISVREAATFQTFPKRYKFHGEYMDHVCDIVGNALPCDFAKKLALHCRDAAAAAGKPL